MPDIQTKINEPQYENWLTTHQLKVDKHHLVKSSFLDITFPNVNGLQLSTRRGPEVELYDVAGVHLLSSNNISSINQDNKYSWFKFHQLKSFFKLKPITSLSSSIGNNSSIILSNQLLI
ncbi:unnamed protein product [Heterobilharzia americana]|nr:unnamed protein product [Heterobilharzia americana]